MSKYELSLDEDRRKSSSYKMNAAIASDLALQRGLTLDDSEHK